MQCNYPPYLPNPGSMEDCPLGSGDPVCFCLIVTIKQQ